MEDYEKIREIIKEEMKPVHDLLGKHETTLHGPNGTNGLCGGYSTLKVQAESTQKELTEHKQGHLQYAALILTGAGICSGIIVAIINHFASK